MHAARVLGERGQQEATVEDLFVSRPDKHGCGAKRHAACHALPLQQAQEGGGVGCVAVAEDGHEPGRGEAQQRGDDGPQQRAGRQLEGDDVPAGQLVRREHACCQGEDEPGQLQDIR